MLQIERSCAIQVWMPAFTMMVILAGCSEKKDGESTARSPAPASSQESVASAPAEIASISDNPAFFTAVDRVPDTDATQHLDRLIRPVLVELFGGARLIAEAGPAADDPLRKEVLATMTYVVRRLLAGVDADELHAKLLAAGFHATPRYGAKPVHGRVFVLMSLSRSTSGASYSLGIRIDLNKQTIQVESFTLGSKYDRL